MRIRVLIFDDDDAIRDLLKAVVKIKGYEIFDYRNPSECSISINEKCNCGQSQCTDVIMTDIEMPIVNGIEFINDLSSKGCKVNNILIISGQVEPQTMDDVKNKNIRFIKKPFSIRDILSVLEEFEKNINPSRTLINL